MTTATITWRPATDPPSGDDEVLIVVDGLVWLGWYAPDLGWRNSGAVQLKNVTWWASLPSPPGPTMAVAEVAPGVRQYRMKE